MKLIKLLRKFRRVVSSYEPLVEILISQKKLIGNLRYYQQLYPEVSVAPVLKSNAYGHGLVEVAEILDKENLPFFCVDSLYEALLLRKLGIRTKILVIGYTSPSNINAGKQKDFSFAITSLSHLQDLAQNLKNPTEFHLKIDTGMHRQGITMRELPEAALIIKSSGKINLAGIYSHLSDAADEAFTRQQIVHWNKAVADLRKDFPELRFFHLSATSGVRFSKEISANAIRIGLGLYLANPVLCLRSIVTSVKNVDKGEFVGYDRTLQAVQPMKIATVPVGYFEGVDLRLSNRGYFKVNDIFCPIAGRVSMNITTIDASSISSIKAGETVTVISNQPEDLNSAENIAKICGTIPYEILIHIPSYLRRTVV
ncbi:MAG: alanine racemase [Candidatus Doudnabacteria bacterium RIFCSPLOWO2_02_FULL_48_8]|nr:MAG: alanine racemase [Candidatus Doudnabacteria bacterium RIFCSPLOWO2_02_FULL_48_8]